jgi:glycosyltransferase involved in cell wall biosynthesis
LSTLDNLREASSVVMHETSGDLATQLPAAERPAFSFVVPVYDEAPSLRELAEQIRAVCDDLGADYEVWFVDDGSRDDSWAVIESLSASQAEVGGLRMRRNYGKSAALAVGFERAQGEYVVTLDADLQDDPAELPRLVDKLEEGYDLVSGWKRVRKDPLSKTLPSRFFNRVTALTSGIALHDFNCGFKLYRREVVESVRVYGELHRYIPLLAKWEGYDRIAEVAVNHRPRKYGRTKFGLERFVRGFLDLVTVAFMTRFAARPMHFFGSLGSLAFIGGFVVSFWLSFEKLFHGKPLSDRPLLLLGVLLMVAGIQMFTVGLIGEMIVRPRMERTDTYDVAESLPPGGER